MQYLSLLFILLFLSISAKSSDFSVIIDKPFNNALFDVTQDYDREISAIGFTREYETSFGSSETYTNAFDYLESVSKTHGSQTQLIKLNSAGVVTLSKTSKLSKFNEAVAVVKTPSNGYFVGGYTLDGSLLISKLDSYANVIFTKTFGTKNYDRMSNLILLSDGGVLAVGSSVTTRSATDPMFETGLGLNDIYVTRFSKNGTKLWSKKYGTKDDDRGIDAVEAMDGSILLVGTTSSHQKRSVTLARINENGNKIWLKEYKSDTLITPYKIIRLRDNNFLLSLSQTNDMHKEQIRLIKFDLQQNVLIDKEINTEYSSALKDIKEYSDGRIIGVGYVRDTYNTDALTMILSNDLSLLIQDHYGEANNDIFNAVTILHNSQAVAVGINTAENSQEANMWIVKFNIDGSLSQSSINTPTLSTQLTEQFKKEIQSKQLSSRENLTLSFLDKSLYFKQGAYKLTKQQKKFLDSFSKKLINFLNTNRSKIASLEINGHTSSEWGNSDFQNGYLNNASLSQKRAYSVLSYIFKMQDSATQKYLTTILKSGGYSYARRSINKGVEDREDSRRVSFKIIAL